MLLCPNGIVVVPNHGKNKSRKENRYLEGQGVCVYNRCLEEELFDTEASLEDNAS